MKTWVIILLIYAAPPTAVDWPGPWTKGMVIAGDKFYRTEGESRNDGRHVDRESTRKGNAGAGQVSVCPVP